MTQPAVSNHLHVLEERFGVTLLVRGGRARATPAGETLAGHARSVLDRLSVLEAEMARHAGPCGRLVVGASSTPGELLLPALAADFASRYPDVALDARVADTDATLAALLAREVEVALVGWAVDHPRLIGSIMEEEELVPVVAAADGPEEGSLSPGDLSEMPFIMREEGSATRRAVEAGLRKAGIRVRVAMELGSNAAVTGAVAAGAGIGVIPARAIASQPNVRVLEMRGLSIRRPFVLVVERERALSPAAEAFVEMCVERNER